MKRYGWLFCWLLLAGLPAGAQAPVGDGWKGEYYDGRNFERYVLTRSDEQLNFDWHRRSPAAGVPAENFSVRWTGWLVPPTTGRYELQFTADDGVRLWLNGRLLLNEWRGQEPTTFKVAVNLKAGEPYALRIDYSQYGWDTRALLMWQPPVAGPSEKSWRNAWGMTNIRPGADVIPTRYLFSTNPKPVALSSAIITGRPTIARPATPAPPLAAAPRRRPAAAVRRISPPRPGQDATTAAAAVARLAAGQLLTLHNLYFAQGKAYLPMEAQASLDSLATALHQRPTLRLEVQGHTDNQGDSALNRQLSQRRAEAVCQYLAAHGVLATQLRPVGYGGTRPIADNNLPAERPRNRRVVLRPLP